MFNDIACNGLSSTLFQCVDLNNIGIYNCGDKNNTAGVICEKTTSDSVSDKKHVIKFNHDDYIITTNIEWIILQYITWYMYIQYATHYKNQMVPFLIAGHI